MNITLSIDNDLATRARRIAEARGISLNQLVREELERVTQVSGGARSFARLRELLERHPGNSGGWKFDRDEIYDRPIFR